ncbi:MAG: dipeptidase [Anaerolineales bacterium]
MNERPDIILDAHLDIAMNHVALGRDFTQATWVTQARENKLPGMPYDGIGVAAVGLPDMLLGRVALVFGTLWVCPPFKTPLLDRLFPHVGYETPEQAYRQALRQMDYYHRLADEHERIQLVRTRAELNAVLATWGPGTTLEEHHLGIVVSMEGADPILEPKQLEEWVARGVRAVGPAWMATRYAAGTGAPGRLTGLGRELLEVMADFQLLLDLSHLAEDAYLEAVDRYEGPLMASHSNPRRFVDSDRHLSDAMIRRLAERDGVVGVVLYNRFMQEGWTPGSDRKTDVTMRDVLDIIDHICQVTGSARHVGIGTDWDGGFGWESIPAPFDSHLDLWRLRAALAGRGYDEDDIRAILAGNFLRQLEASLPT